MAQFARPASDGTTGGWSSTPLWSKVDDAVSAADGVVITSDNNTSPDIADFSLTSINDPGVSTGHTIRALWRKSASGGHSINAVAELWQGVPPASGPLIATLSVTGIGSTLQTDTYTLSASEADNITDYGALSLRVIRQGDTGGNPNGRRSLVVDAVEFETPDAQAGITGTFAATDAPDTFEAAGSVSTNGTLDTTEAADTFEAAGTVTTSGVLTATETADTLAASGEVAVTGALATTDPQDIFGATEESGVTGTFTATEGQDGFAAAGSVLVDGSLAASEGTDVFDGAGSILVSGALGATEPADSLTGTGTLSYIGQLAASEGEDVCDGIGQVRVSGSSDSTDTQDVFAGASEGASPIGLLVVSIIRRRRRLRN